jgi:hypothetical protein
VAGDGLCPICKRFIVNKNNHINHLRQWFSNCGARPPGGAWGAWKGTAYFPTDKN